MGQPRNANVWTAQDWRAFYDERAAIREFDGGLPRPEAERRTLNELEGHWLALNPMPPGTPEAGCVQCKGGAGAPDLLPHVAAGKGHFWLHSRCWSEFDKARRSEALAALRKLIPDLAEMQQ